MRHVRLRRFLWLAWLSGCCFSAPWDTVQAAYDRISANFAESRRFPWPFVLKWLEGGKGELLVAGCGDGRHVATAVELGVHDAIHALDLSEGMLRAAERRLGARAGHPEQDLEKTFDVNVIYSVYVYIMCDRIIINQYCVITYVMTTVWACLGHDVDVP